MLILFVKYFWLWVCWVMCCDEKLLVEVIENCDWLDWYVWVMLEVVVLKCVWVWLCDEFGFFKFEIYVQVYWNVGCVMGIY